MKTKGRILLLWGKQMFRATARKAFHRKLNKVTLPGNKVMFDVPVKYRYIAVDSDGGVTAFVTKPFVKTEYYGFTEETEYWTTRKNRVGDFYPLGCILFIGDWKESLMRIEGNYSEARPVKQKEKQ